MAASDDLRRAEAALRDPNFRGTFDFEGKQYTRTQLRDELIPLLKERERTESTAATRKETEAANLAANIRKAQSRVDDLRDALIRNRNAFSRGRYSEEQLIEDEKKLDEAIANLDALTGATTTEETRVRGEAARAQVDELKKAERKTKSTKRKEQSEKDVQIGRAKSELDNAVRGYDLISKSPSSTTAQLQAAAAAVEKARNAYNTLVGTPPATTRPTTTTTPVRAATTVTAPTDDGSAQRAETARMGGTTPIKPPKGSGGSGTSTAGTAVAPVDKRKKRAAVDSILDELAEQFPAYQDWTVEQATAYFGDDLIKVFNDVASGKYGVGDQKNKEAIQRAIRGTRYWKTTEAAIRDWDGLEVAAQTRRVEDQKRNLAEVFGELGLDDATLTDLATTIQRTGLNELGARQLVYGAAFARPRTETGLQPRQLALESSVADQIRRIAKSYGFMPTDLDAQIESILTGQQYAPTGQVLTTDAFRQKAERYARGQYAHLKDQFDSGLTLEDIFGNYRELASRVLELDPTEIDFAANPEKWSDAFGSKETGQLSLSQWVAKLKSDEKYGWQFTQNARDKATNLVMEMEKAFGFRR